MRNRAHRRACCVVTLGAVLTGWGSHAWAGASVAPLLVMLQGNDLQAIAASAERHGARITHHLPIISAIGATMSAEQLEAIRNNTPEISRIIDDLAWEPDPHIEVDRGCQLASAIELRWSGATAEWTLFNKGEDALSVGGGRASWPATLGRLVSATAGESALTVVPGEADGKDVLAADWSRAVDLSLPPHSQLTLRFSFAQAPKNAAAIQSAIQVNAVHSSDCQTRLVPSYDAPADDSYYASVSGAALLHSYGITGAGVTVAIMDSGLWEAHPELALDTQRRGRIKARYDAILGREVHEAVDESGHGTHMTSVLARSGAVVRKGAPRPSYRGIAPDADIVVVKAIGDSGEAGFLDIVRGVQWVVDNRDRLQIRVLNLSFAARPRWPYWEDPVNQAIMRAWEAGIFIAAAAGNEGPDSMSVGSPGNLPYLLTVGAITDSWTERERNDDYIPDFSSRGPTPMGHIKPDLVAPGGHMAGIVPPGSVLAEEFPEYHLSTGEFVMTGTSQATALVSGLAALLLQAEPELTNSELKCMLRTSTEPAIELDGRLAYSPFIQGDGLVSIQRALTIGQRHCEQTHLDISADISGPEHYQGPAIFRDEQPPTLPGQAEAISDRPSEKGLSATRRWGAAAHLERLTTPPSAHPFDWASIRRAELRRIGAIARNKE